MRKKFITFAIIEFFFFFLQTDTSTLASYARRSDKQRYLRRFLSNLVTRFVSVYITWLKAVRIEEDRSSQELDTRQVDRGSIGVSR